MHVRLSSCVSLSSVASSHVDSLTRGPPSYSTTRLLEVRPRTLTSRVSPSSSASSRLAHLLCVSHVDSCIRGPSSYSAPFTFLSSRVSLSSSVSSRLVRLGVLAAYLSSCSACRLTYSRSVLTSHFLLRVFVFVPRARRRPRAFLVYVVVLVPRARRRPRVFLVRFLVFVPRARCRPCALLALVCQEI
jgi:hypothetical protein